MAVPATDPREVSLTIDGVAVTAPEGATIWEAARSAGIELPVLCHDPRYDPVGVCRVCVVDLGQHVLAASCVRTVEDGMEVETGTDRVESQRRMLVRLLMADAPAAASDPKETTTADNELLALSRRYGIEDEHGLPAGDPRPDDSSSPVIDVHHGACILCDRCVRACDDVQGNDVIGRTGKGYEARIAFDLDDPMGESSCVSCGECVAACPTGALLNKPITVPLRPRQELEQVDTVCPYCGVGCALTYHVDREENAIVFADGRDQPGSQRRLCVKGRYGWDYALSPQRLTR
ncbi:MAG: 2Fe-2S iron-sulfur cluster-binding protein, partial [Gaiellales bacterium]